MFLILMILNWVAVAPWAAPGDPVELEKIVVTSSRMAQANYKLPSNVTVIDREDITASGAQNISDVLRQELGVNVYDTSTVKTSVVDIRGFGDTATRNVLVLVNDRKVNSIDISGPDLIQIPLESVERIEIIRGAGSVLYGDNAVGGVVNIITKKGKGDLSGKTTFSGGSYHTRGGDVELSGSKKKLSYYHYSKYYDHGGYRSNSELLSKDFTTRIGYDLSKRLSGDLWMVWHEDGYRLPGGLNDTELQTLGRRGSANENDFASSKDRSVKLNLDILPWPEDLAWGHVTFDYSYRNRDTYALFDFGASGATATKRTIDTHGISTKYIFDHELFNCDVNFVTGLDYYDVENDILGSGAGLSISTDDLTISKEELGAYLYGEYELIRKLFVNAGGRYQKAYYTFDRMDTPFYETRDPSVQAYLFGLKYEYAQASNVYLNVQQTFRFLATDEWYDTFAGLNTNLKEQTGIQYEVGLKHNFDDRLVLSITPYWMDIKDEIFFDPVSIPFGSNRNYDKTRRRGLEIGSEVDVLKFIEIPGIRKLEFFSNYTYQKPRFRDGTFDGKDIPLVARHQATGGVRLHWGRYTQISLSSSYVGSRFAINDTLNETPPVKPYYTLDSKIAWSLSSWEAFVAVNNILNEKYFSYVVKSTTSTVKDHYPAPERNFQAGVGWRF